MIKFKLDLDKLNKLDKDKPYIFNVEVGHMLKSDITHIKQIRDLLIDDLGFKSIYFVPTVNGESEVTTLNLGDFILKEN